MWKRSDVIEGHDYRVGLMATEDGSRKFHLLDSDATWDGYDFVTPVVDDHELLRWRRFEEIISRYGTEGGTEIVVDAHGLWLTAHEVDQLEDDVSEIQWYRGIAPAFAPK
jgi:hypothetical protein